MQFSNRTTEIPLVTEILLEFDRVHAGWSERIEHIQPGLDQGS
jgi:hypothetical protein